MCVVVYECIGVQRRKKKARTRTHTHTFTLTHTFFFNLLPNLAEGETCSFAPTFAGRSIAKTEDSPSKTEDFSGIEFPRGN